MVISKAGQPIADLVPHRATPVVFGGLAGGLKYDDDSFAGVDQDIQTGLRLITADRSLAQPGPQLPP